MNPLKPPFWGLFAAAAMLLANASDAHAEKRVALVIGNSSYVNVRALANPERDANAVAALFRSAKFDVVEAHNNVTGNGMRRAIRSFSDLARDADVAVVYYAGHGIEVDGANYLLPVDAVLERDLDVDDEAVSLDRIVRTLEPVKQLRLVILDACRDNPFVPKMKRLSATRSIGRGLAKVEPTMSNTLIAFSAKAGSTAADGDGEHSPFTIALLKHLPTPGLDLRLAFGRIRDEVMKETRNRQEPFVYGSLGGTTVSLVPAAATVAAVAPPAPITTPAPSVPRPALAPAPDPTPLALADYELASRVGTVEAWEAFIRAHPTGFHADLARAQRDKAMAARTAVAVVQPPALPEVRKPTVDPTEVARSVQSELTRLGCFTGDANAPWSRASREAVERFNRQTGMKLDVAAASTDTLDALRGRSGRICPLQCGPGFIVSDGRCERKPTETAKKPDTKKPAESKKPEQADRRRDRREALTERPRPQSSSGGGGGQIVCGMNGCLTVKPGCRGSTIPSGSGEVAVVSC
jgi:hypothetical protein